MGCAAPHAALYLTPNGAIQACCRNDDLTVRIGTGDRPTLRQVWNGPMLARLRDAVDRDDYSYGCQSCERAIAAGGRETSVAADFDRYLGERNLPGPKHLDLALSNTCNLTCEMCSGDLSSAIRSGREHRAPLASPYDDAFFEDLRDLLPGVESIIFKGGEPFLARETRRVWEMLEAIGSTAHVTVVTNGTRWGPEVERWMRTLQMDVHVSIDGGSAETVEAIRTGADHEVLRSNLEKIVATARSYGGTVSWNFCHMPQNSHELAEVLRQADDLDIDVQIIPVDSPPRFSLGHAPLALLEELLARHEGASADAAALGRNRHVWDGEVALLRRRVAHARTASASPVSIRERSDDHGAFESAVAELRAWSGREVLRVVIDDAIVTAVEPPPWADLLAADAWVGIGGQDLIGQIEARLGPVHPAATIDERPPVVMTSLEFGAGDACRAARSVRCAVDLPSGVQRTFVGIAIEP